MVAGLYSGLGVECGAGMECGEQGKGNPGQKGDWLCCDASWSSYLLFPLAGASGLLMTTLEFLGDVAAATRDSQQRESLCTVGP